MDLTVKTMDGKTKLLHVDHNATVHDLKQMISPHFSVNPHQQRLSTNNGERIDLDNDSLSLSSYGLRSGSTVALLITNMQVFVKNEKGYTSTYDVNADETVDHLQQKIYNKEKTPMNQQRLIFNGTQLESGRMLRDYNITSGSTMHKTLRLRGG